MSRQQRRRDGRQGKRTPDPLLKTDAQPWYYRHGYHVGVWTGGALGVIWFAVFQDLIGLIAGIVLGQVAGILLGRRGRR